MTKRMPVWWWILVVIMAVFGLTFGSYYQFKVLKTVFWEDKQTERKNDND